jgi:hypothetical protein
VRAPCTPQPCRMIAAIVNGKSCIVLSIEVPPRSLGATPPPVRSGECYRRTRL